MQIIVDSAPIDYSDKGTGKTLVFLHGWKDSKATWKPLMHHLVDQYRCVAFDLPNFGASGENDACITPKQYAEQVALALEKLNIDHYTLVGHSMGGQIAMYGVGEGILRPVHLILIAAAGVRQKSAAKKVLQVAAKSIGVMLPSQVKKWFYARIGSDYDPGLSPVLKRVIAAMLSTDVTAQAAAVKVPTTLLYGAEDTATPPEYGKLLHEHIAGSQYIEVESANHWLHKSAASDIATIVKKVVQ